MRKAISAVLAAVALFGGVAISNGAANADVVKDGPYSNVSCDKRAEQGLKYQICDVYVKSEGSNNYDKFAGKYAFVDGLDSNWKNVTIPEKLGGVDVLQIGWFEHPVENRDNVTNVSIEAGQREFTEIGEGVYTTVSKWAFQGANSLETVAFNGNLIFGEYSFENKNDRKPVEVYNTVYNKSGKGTAVAEFEGAFNGCHKNF